MKEILEELGNLIGICESRIKQNDSEKSELASLRLNLTTQKEEQAETEKYLKDENEKLTRKKLIASTIAEAESIKKKASVDADSIARQREILERDQKTHNEKVSNENADIDRKKKKMLKDREDLDREKEGYKEKLRREITKNLAN